MLDASYDAHLRAKTDVELSGTVFDITGGTVAGASVKVGAQQAITDKAGMFSIWLAAEQRLELHVVADGYAETKQQVAAPNQVKIYLTPEGSIDGVVLDGKTNKPVAGALVEAEAIDVRPFAISDADGKFHIANLAPDRYAVTARTPHGYGRAKGSIGISLAQRVEGVTVKIDTASRITGRVENCPTPPPVVLRSIDVISEVEMMRDPDGLYHVDGVPNGKYTIEINCEHLKYFNASIVVDNKDLGPLTWTIQPDPDEKVEIDDDSATVHGKVTDPKGNGVSCFVSASGDAHPGSAATTTGGTYTMKLKPGVYDIGAGHDSFHTTDEKHVTLTAHQDLELNFSMPANDGVIKGDVKDAQGHPVADAFVEAWISTGFDWIRSAYDLQPVVTDANGTFTIDNLAPGFYNVEASRRGGGTAMTKGVALGSSVHLVIPTLGTLQGTATYEDGALAEQFSVKVREAKSNAFYRDEESYHQHGEWVMHDVPEGTYNVTFTADDGTAVTTTVLAAGETKTVDGKLVRMVNAHGRLVDDKGAPIAGWMVVPKAKASDNGMSFNFNDKSHVTDANGAFSIPVPKGAIELHVAEPSSYEQHMRGCMAQVDLEVTADIDVGTLTIVKPCTLRR
ncbi:MAG: carboxypeptidase regulatory-like domain-containing protein [Kofleriaceae bacterium]